MKDFKKIYGDYMVGVDISKHNNLKKEDFIRLRNSGIRFVILRAGYGKSIKQIDECFINYYKYAKDSGLNVGCYWYSYAKNKTEILKEAQCFYTIIKDMIFEMPVYLDFEEKFQFELPKDKINEMIKSFLDYMENKNYWVGLYMSKYYLENYVNIDIRNRYAIWVAQYSSMLSYKGQYGIWQYTGNGKIYGIKGNIDIDKCIVNYPKYICSNKKNGYGNKKSINKIVDEVLDGYWGNGVNRQILLNEAGYDYFKIQDLVNRR